MRKLELYCKHVCPQRFGCRRYLSREVYLAITDMSKVKLIHRDPYDYRRLACRYFISKTHDKAGSTGH